MKLATVGARSYSVWLCVVLAVGLALRIWGIRSGLPNDLHYFSYHPDESMVLFAAMRIDLLHGRFLPHFYNYGSLQLILINFVNTVAFVFGGAPFVIRAYATHHAALAQMYLLGRLLSVAMGVGTVWATASTGTRLWGRRAGLLAAAFLAVMPLHVQQSHWCTVDVPSAFWEMLCFLALAHAISERRAASRWTSDIALFAWAGVAIGFASATKYNMGLLAIPAGTALFLGPRRPVARCAAVCAASCVIAFVAGCPGFIWDHSAWVRDFLYEVHHTRSLPGIEFVNTGNGLLYLVGHTLDAALGLPMLLLSGVGLAMAVKRRSPGDILLAGFSVVYTAVISIAVVRYARYAIPLLPILALWCGAAAAPCFSVYRASVRSCLIGLCALTGAGTAAYAVWVVAPMAGPETRDVAYRYIIANDGNNFTVGYPRMPWFQSVPVSPWMCLPIPGRWTSPGLLTDDLAKRVVYSTLDWDVVRLRVQAPQVVVISEFDRMDAVRLQLPSARDYMAYLRGAYSPGITFGHRRPPLGVFMPDLPNDMLHNDPEITVYTRRAVNVLQ